MLGPGGGLLMPFADGSDLFSLGLSRYPILCGKPPCEGESTAQLMYKNANEPPPDLRSLNPAVPAALVAFLARALNKNPGRRIQTDEVCAADLRAAFAGAAAGTALPRPAGARGTVDIEL